MDEEGKDLDEEGSDANDKDVDQTGRDMDTSSDNNDCDLKPKAKKGLTDANTGCSKGTLEVEKSNDVGRRDV